MQVPRGVSFLLVHCLCVDQNIDMEVFSMSTISLCMIVKDEEDVIARCLESAKEIADEIIIVDTGSTDKTKEIVSSFTDKIFDFPWIQDFSAARNFSFDQATMDYCMWLDADDIILPEDKESLINLKKELSPTIDIVMMKYHTSFDSDGTPTFSYFRERLIRNGKGFLWESPVHEAITPSGQIIYSEIGITHAKLHPSDPLRNLNIFEHMVQNGTPLDKRQQFYYARELYYHQRYQDAVDVLTEFLKDKTGWIENNIEGCKYLSYSFYKLGKEEQALEALFRSFVFDAPRAEICCDIGQHFLDRHHYHQAIFWYQIALSSPKDDTRGGFILKDTYDYIPSLQLCVCYDKLQNYTLAQEFNEKAGLVKPNSDAYLKNKQYFLNKLKESTL